MFNIALPEDYRRFEKDGFFLFFDPHNFSWLRVNKDGAFIVDSIKTLGNVSAIIEHISATYAVPREEIVPRVEKFIEMGIKAGFFHEEVYKRLTFSDNLNMFPENIYLNVSNQCNLNCRYCFNKADRAAVEDHEELNVSDYERLFKDVCALGSKRAIFTGGEPLLHNHIFEIASKARQLGLQTELLTNGVLINRDNCHKIVSAFDSVTISLDSHFEEIHDQQRGIGTFKKVIEAVTMLREKNVRWINLSTVITDNSIKTLQEYMRFALETLKADNVINQLCLPYTRKILDEEEKLLPKPADALLVDDQIDQYFSKKPRKTGQQPLFRAVTCGACTDEISIAPNGDVFPCHTLQKSEFFCGSIQKKSIKDIFQTSKIIKFFKELTVNKIETCAHCDVRHICGGGCRALAYAVSGKIDGFNSFSCDYLRQKAIKKLWASSDYQLETTAPTSQENQKPQPEET